MPPFSPARAVPARDLPPVPGLTLAEGGVEVAVYAGHADRVELCLFDADDPTGASERRIELTGRAHGWWFDFVPDIGPGQHYGFRVDGDWDPDRGQRHNPHKLLVDPYARALDGEVRWGPAVFGHGVDESWRGEESEPSRIDSAAGVPRSVLVDERFDWGGDRAPRHLLADSLVYEVHVKNFTARMPGVPDELRGTYAGLAHPAAIAHLTDLGVTAVELLPVHAFADEPFLARRGLTNHWGYNTLGFFAPHAGYAAATTPQGVVDEFKGMVKLLHRAGIEVILDVVYNHTCEQGGDGPTLSWRGLDNRAYYRLDERGRDIDVTGCGNTLDLRHPVVARMVLDSLRYWVTECHVDGFRFDLAVALARGRSDDYDPDHPFLIALRTDPVLSRAKLVAEPWDVGIHGWRTGQFPPPFSEWNDRFRDAARTFWVSDLGALTEGGHGHGLEDLATRMSGSQDLFWARDRGVIASVNFVTAHDGFTLADLTAFNGKHNLANLEDNRDGSDHNRSWNHGVEGPTDDPEVLALRRRTMRNLLATTILSAGVPMLNAGDEFGRTQLGNNNAYCQDGPISWFDWALEPWQEELLATTRQLTRIRRDHPVLRQRQFHTGERNHSDGVVRLSWFGADGQPIAGRWADPGVRTVQMHLDGRRLDADSVLIVVHGGVDPTVILLPEPDGHGPWELLWDSAHDHPRAAAGTLVSGEQRLEAASLRVYRSPRTQAADTEANAGTPSS
jgi:glycogen operon protein